MAPVFKPLSIRRYCRAPTVWASKALRCIATLCPLELPCRRPAAHGIHDQERGCRRRFLAGRPWRFTELLPPALEDDWDIVDRTIARTHRRSWRNLGGPKMRPPRITRRSSDGATDDHLPGETRRLYSIGVGGNPSYEAPRMRYSFASYTRPGELHEIDPATGEDALLKRATVLGDFNPRDYMERRVWITARDGERIPVSLVWRAIARRRIPPMFITGYGAYEIILRSGVLGLSSEHVGSRCAVRRAAHSRRRRNGTRLV